jgi:hypothetical protein
MRPLVIIASLNLVTTLCLGQRQVNGRIIDSITNKPLSKIAFYILRDNDKWINVGDTDSAGYFKGEIERKEFSKKSSYQVSVDKDEYNSAKVDVSTIQEDTVLIKLTKNENYIPKIKGMTYRDCSQVGFGDYEPKEPRTLSDLPIEIKEKVVTHIKDRVGNNFYSRLILTGGQIVDLNRLQKLENYIKEYKWTPQSYYLCFSFSDTSVGIARFTAKIVLDKSGKVIEEIELPNINNDPSKGQIINMQQAIEIAAKNNYLEKDSFIDFDYDSKEDCFVWMFKKSTFNKDHTMYYKLLLISAHTGKVLGDAIGGVGRWH